MRKLIKYLLIVLPGFLTYTIGKSNEMDKIYYVDLQKSNVYNLKYWIEIFEDSYQFNLQNAIKEDFEVDLIEYSSFLKSVFNFDKPLNVEDISALNTSYFKCEELVCHLMITELRFNNETECNLIYNKIKAYEGSIFPIKVYTMFRYFKSENKIFIFSSESPLSIPIHSFFSEIELLK